MKKWFPYFLWVAVLGWLFSSLRLPNFPNSFHPQEFGALPILEGGRLKPMDTVARTSLMILSGKQTLSLKGNQPLSATEWLMDVMMKPERSDNSPVFRIDHPDVLSLLGFQQTSEKYFSYQQLQPHFPEIERQAQLTESVKTDQHSLFQKEILKLFHQIDLYQQLKNSLRVDEDVDFTREIRLFEQSLPSGLQAIRAHQAGKNFNKKDFDLLVAFLNRYDFLSNAAYILPIPPIAPEQNPAHWLNIGQSLLESAKNQTIHPTVCLYASLVTAYRESDAATFNLVLATLRQQLEQKFHKELFKTDYEFRFNHFQPFYKSMILYVFVFILIFLAWLRSSKTLNRMAFYLLLLSFVIHTLGLISRMYLQGRPPVTNLYSSAVFVGWGAVGLAIILEKIYRNGIGSVVAATMGFLTLLIAHHLSGNGDTMEMLRAVLDTNYWLATHVVIVTLGYASTFLAGFLAIVYILRGLFTQSLDETTAQSIERMVYGIICFAMFFSFVGTILGGIWADQSWGRFWGWDPKENGALIIVLWNAIILHARSGDLIKQRGLIRMAVFGNMITSFSWFGVNMLGVGLHSYGFIDKAFFWLTIFCLTQMVIIGMAFLPLKYWRSRYAFS